MPKSAWSDEGWSLQLASKPLLEVIQGSLADVHPPLYFILLHFSPWPKLVSLLAGIGLLVVIYKLAKLAFGREVAHIAAFLVALSPYAMHQTGELRGYALASLLVTSSLYLALKKRYGWAAIAGILAFLTEHYCWLLLPYFLAIGAWRSALIVLWVGLPMLGLGVWQAVHSEHAFHAYRVAEYSNLIWKKVGGLAFHWSTGYRYAMIEWSGIPWGEPIFQFCLFVTILMGGLFLVGLVRLWRGPYRNLILVGLIVPILILTSLYPIRVDARYLAPLWPLYILVVSVSLGWLDRFLRIFSMTLIGACMALVLVYQIPLPWDPIHKEDWRGAKEYVQEFDPLYDGILVTRVTNMQAHVRDRQRQEVIDECGRLWEYDGEERFPEDGLVTVYKFRSKN